MFSKANGGILHSWFALWHHLFPFFLESACTEAGVIPDDIMELEPICLLDTS